MAKTPTGARTAETTMREHAADADLLGFVVTWDVESILIDQARTREMLLDAGLNIPLGAVRESTALNRALDELADSESGVRIGGEMYRVEKRKIGSDQNEIAYGFVQLEGDMINKRIYAQQTRTIVYHKTAKEDEDTITYDSLETRRLIEPLVRKFKTSFIARDITSDVFGHAIKRAAGTKMRQQGGMYWVLATGEETLEQCRTFTDMLASETDTAAHFTVLPVPDGKRERESMRYHSHKAFVAEAQALRTKLKDMLRKDRAGRVSAETVAGYIAQAREVGDRIALYRDAMQLRTAELSDVLRALATAYNAVLTGTESTIEELAKDQLGAVDAAFATANGVNAKTAADDAGDSDDPTTIASDLQAMQRQLEELAAQQAATKSAQPKAPRVAKSERKPRKSDGDEIAAAVAAAFGPQAVETPAPVATPVATSDDEINEPDW